MNHLQPTPPDANFLVDLVPVRQRRIAYALYGLVGALVGAIFLAVLAVTAGSPPVWLVVLVVVHNFAAPFFGALATANARPTGQEAAEL